MIDCLNTQRVNTTFEIPFSPPAGSTQQELKIPAPYVLIPKSLSYNFRVAEHMDKQGNIVKVGLQIAVFEHDNYGVRQLRQDWTDVERVKVDYVAPVG